MDRLNQIRGEAGSSRDLTLDTTSPPSEAYMTANESSTKYFSLSEVDSTFEISPSKDAPQSADSDRTITDNEIITNLSPIPKSPSYHIGKQIEAANILSGGVDIFEDNENSYDGDELVIDDNVVGDDDKTSEKFLENTVTPLEKTESVENTDETEAIPSMDTEVVLQIDGKNVNAIDIGNGLYLYRKAGLEELAAVQIVDDDQQQPSFKFLKVRENAEGNLEVYEEIKVEVPKEVPTKEGNTVEKTSHVPIKDISKVINEPSTKVDNKIAKAPKNESVLMKDLGSEPTVDLQTETKSEVNLNGKMMKFNEARKSPVIGTFTPMTYHSTPNKEGIPLTKTMVDQQLHPSRHSDNIKKTIEVHTDSCRQKISESPIKNEESSEITKFQEVAAVNPEKEEAEEAVKEEKQLDIDEKGNKVVNIESENNTGMDMEIETFKSNIEPNENMSKHEDLTGKLEISSDKQIIKDISKENEGKPEISQEASLTNEFKESESKQDAKIKTIEDIKNNSDEEDKQNKDLLIRNSTDEPMLVIDIDNEISLNQNLNDKAVPQKTDSSELNIIDQNNVSTVPLSLSENNIVTDKTEVQSSVNNLSLPDTQIESKDIVINQKEIPKSKDTTDIKNIINNKVCDVISLNNISQSDTINEKKEISMINEAPLLQKSNMPSLNNTGNQSNSNNMEEIKAEVSSKIPDKDTKVPNSITDTQKQLTAPKSQTESNKTVLKAEISEKIAPTKAIINNNSAVPFGKWTEANRQEFLNKIKETKIPATHTNTKQLKQPNDLNRRDILKKIDSQRQTSTVSAKAPMVPKLNSKKETIFVNKPSTNVQANIPESKVTSVKAPVLLKPKPVIPKKVQQEPINFTLGSKKSIQRKEINNQDLIDKTIEGIINRAITGKVPDNVTDVTAATENQTNTKKRQVSLDDIEMKMNELHGIQSEQHTSQQISETNLNSKNYFKSENLNLNKNKVPHLLPFKNKEQPNVKESVGDEPSDEEVIEHEPITGDIDINKQSLVSLLSSKEKPPEPRKESIITEKDFDKFARRNSITYENRLTVNFDGKEPHNVIQTVVEKEQPVKKLSRNEIMLAESKAKSINKQKIAMRHSNQVSKIPVNVHVKTANEDDAINKNYQSKVQIAYQTALTAKRSVECPISIIEDKPVKVVYLDSNMEFTPMQLNVQGQNLSPSQTFTSDSDTAAHSASESLDSDILESSYEIKTPDEMKSKSKHQRKQVLTPVEVPELELIEPGDLGIEVSPKKKRKLDEKNEKSLKNLAPKKSYLLNRNTTDEHVIECHEVTKKSEKYLEKHNEITTPTDSINAIDSLVKAAEFIETCGQPAEIPQNSPIKRGRGRPRKYPLPESGLENKTPTPQKKPRLIDAKPKKYYTDSDESSDGEIIKENWTMGKINENIVCPICNKLFRSENVVFKHVKHCTGPSPNRSDSDKRSPRRFRHSRDSERRSLDSDSDYTDDEEITSKNRKTNYNISKSIVDNEDVVVIEDIPVKEKVEKNQKPGTNQKISETKKDLIKGKLIHRPNNIICEICGKTFRQMSYLAHHKLQHKKEIRNLEERKKLQTSDQITSKSVFSCEVCRKEFRKLHHLVQHRLIHNSTSVRKSSSEQGDTKTSRINDKPSDDASAGFRCEPCDKSFRKLHHLVEHRETHDGINKKGNTLSNNESSNKPSIAYHCDKCNKIFKKLQDYLEHKDQHLETSSEKSDDKSVKSSLSTKDIIHECSLCYMVFPNEHSLNKHTVICLRKKRQSAAKQAAKKAEEKEAVDTDDTNPTENTLQEDEPKQAEDEMPEEILKEQTDTLKLNEEETSEILSEKDNTKRLSRIDSFKEIKSSDSEIKSEKRPSVDSRTILSDVDSSETPHKIKKIEENTTTTIPDTPIVSAKKKTPAKEKVAATVTKRQKSVNVPLPVIDEPKPIESSDDDEVRYMFNPDFKKEDSSERKLFMNVKSRKRNSLQFERPSSKDLVKRRISLQHPPKIPRLKVKAVEARPITSLTAEKKKLPAVEPMPAIDSDDSDVKYSFPKTNMEDVERKAKRQSLVAKRKSLSGIAKRKSLGKHKVTPRKKRTKEIEHRCDCGQLFSSAALLSRHTTLAHTPPRIRRRRSPPPEPQPETKTRAKPKANVQSPKTQKHPKTLLLKKLKTDISNKNNKKSSASEVTTHAPKTEFVGKKLRSSTTKGPGPDSNRKFVDKLKK